VGNGSGEGGGGGGEGKAGEGRGKGREGRDPQGLVDTPMFEILKNTQSCGI